LGPAVELADRGRLYATAFGITVQIFLYWVLWTTLYGTGSGIQGGMTLEQAVSYSALGVLISRTRVLTRDSVYRAVTDGAIVYWFTRPMAPGRYFFLRSAGEALYGSALALIGAVACGFLGLVTAPSSPAVLVVTLISLVLGQVVQYYLTLLVEVSCFWFTTNRGLRSLNTFVQDLCSGAIVPIWFFPPWFIGVNQLLPFQATLNLPVSVHIGRITPAQTTTILLVQAGWGVLLALLSRVLWHAASRRLVISGG
jgi:ABC-2 type transport system permease protein